MIEGVVATSDDSFAEPVSVLVISITLLSSLFFSPSVCLFFSASVSSVFGSICVELELFSVVVVVFVVVVVVVESLEVKFALTSVEDSVE